MEDLLLKVLGGFKKSANIIFSLDENIFDRFFNNEYFKDGIKKITIELGNGDTINLESKTILDFKFYIKDKDKKKEFTKKDIADAFNVPEHYLNRPKSLILLEEGMKIKKVEIPKERPLDKFLETGDINSKPELSNTISSNDIINAKETLEHSTPAPKGWICYNTPGREKGKSWFRDIFMQYWEQNKNKWEFIGVDMINDKDQTVIIDDPLLRDNNIDEDGGYIMPDDIADKLIETIREKEIENVSNEIDKSLTNIEQSEDEYFDNIKPMMVKRDNK